MSTTPQPAATTSHWEGAFAAFSKAYELVKRNPQPAYIIVAVFGLLALLDAVLSGGSANMSASSGGSAFGTLAALIFIVALPVYALKTTDGKKISLGEAMRGDVKRYFYVIVASILAALLMVVSFIAFIIPAIWIVAWFSFTVYPVAEKGMNPNEALRHSKALATNHKGKVWGLIGVSLLLSIIAAALAAFPVIGVVLSGLATGAVTVLSTVAFSLLYRWLQGHVTAQ